MTTSHKKTCIISLFVALACFSLASFARAQFSAPGTGSKLDLKVEPQNPKPYVTVHFIAESFSTDLNKATLDWYVNGKLIKSGKGVKEFDTTVGKLGTKTEVRLSAKTEIGTLGAKVLLQPAQVDLVWQANSFTPPFYKGRALPTHKSGVTVIAIPTLITATGARLDPSDLLYTWKENGTVQGNKSGRGRSSYVVHEISIMRDSALVEVSVAAPSGTLQASGAVGVRPETPKIVLYEHDPLEGIKYNKALIGTYPLVNEEVTLESMPYFFGTLDREGSDILYNWSLNGVKVENDASRQGSLTLRQTGESGFATLTLNVNHRKNLLESVSERLSLEFGGMNTGGFAPTP
ncbi:MAG: Uncharacterized protein G01um101448_207 [Parcubacteria group bacterium Gr01-1014_48]|nr:MAG: Uncharacterized protein Greene041614_959 [Parcubacteria group bacterium Greene0416_14]TSC74331.1 MAG: Uncharacterized protein G01um101448_207 [Parcubacteria group bacterium Gr01-1014_48]TSD01031.1 MAG: Uncharacterized protein Greene101415_532 [Parcubacteria group bacterium Greene1014_15]TSD07723.1 MAG: Uncharacterized protein Greene07144_786 [Parcubacteria group bacterium Greene0714_4]